MKSTAVVLMFFVSLISYGQEQLGLKLENYAGINSVTLNPAGNLTNPLKWDVNLVGGDFFVENNYFFIESTNTIELIRESDTKDFYSVPDFEGAPPSNSFLIDYFRNSKKRFGYLSTGLTGPSIALRIGENQSIGLFTRVRMAMGTQGLQTEFSYYDYDLRPFFESFPTESFESAFMSWSEIGLNYAIQVPTQNGRLGIGINVKFLNGYEAGWFHYGTLRTYEKVSSNTAEVAQLDVSYGYTNSNLIDDSNDFELQKNGNGIAFDLGLVNIIEGTEKDYDFKFGVSILDLGFINFNQNTSVYELQIDSSRIIGGDQYDQYSSLSDLEAVSELFSQQALGSPTDSRAGNSFKLWLPTALSIQAEYAFTENIFFNTTLVQRIPLPSIGLERGNLFAFTPRFEHRWFSASLPLSLYNWQNFRVGLAARLAFLTIGSENLGSFLGHSEFTGTDFYMALKVNFSGGNGGLNFGKNRFKGAGKSKVKCYDF